jgi:hypothetical protein
MDNFKKCVTLLTTLSEDEVGKALQLLEIFAKKPESISPYTHGEYVFFWDTSSKNIQEGRIVQINRDNAQPSYTISLFGRHVVRNADSLYRTRSEAEKAFGTKI